MLKIFDPELLTKRKEIKAFLTENTEGTERKHNKNNLFSFLCLLCVLGVLCENFFSGT